MTTPRFREKDNRQFFTNRLIGQVRTQTTWCPNLLYGSPSSLYYPQTHREGEWTRCWDELHKGPPYRTGGPFFLVRTQSQYFGPKSGTYEYRGYKYDGSFTLGSNDVEVANIAANYAPTARTYGAEAYNKFRPTRPKADAGQWIGELRDLPQNPWPWKVTNLRNNILNFKNLGSMYLNYEFGWKPFIKDLIKVYETNKRIENHLNYMKNNNNKWMTRGGIIKNEQTVTQSILSQQAFPSIPSPFYSSYSWPCTKSVITRDTVWFKARMKYFIQDLETDPCDSVWSSQLLRHMYGLTLTPSLAWELIPFTWLQDWVINIGDVISNFSNSLYDNLVSKYAYVMRHRSTSIVYDENIPLRVTSPVCIGSSWGPTVPKPLALRAVFTAECKERDGTSQYCFGGGGLFNDTMTPRQERILWALGVSRRSH